MKASIPCKTKQLQQKFPELTEAHQQYVLGVTEGLLFAQRKLDGQTKGDNAASEPAGLGKEREIS